MPSSRGMFAPEPIRLTIAVLITIVVTAGVAFVGLQYSHRYTASAYLFGTMKEPAGARDTPWQNDLPLMANQILTDDVIAGIDREQRPYSGLATRFFPKWTAARLRSDLVIEDTYSGAKVGAIGVVFSGSNRDAAVGVADAVAEALARPQQVVIPAVPAVPAGPLPVPLNKRNKADGRKLADEGRGSDAGSTQSCALRATTGTAHPEQESQTSVAQHLAQDRAAQALRLQQLTAALEKHQELQTSVDAEAMSLGAIEAEKAHILTSAHAPAPRPPAPPPDPKRLAVETDLIASTKRLAELRERYTEDYPDVISARERVAELQLDLTKLGSIPAVPERAPVASVKVSDVPERIAALDAREAPIKARLAGMRQQLAAVQSQIEQMRRQQVAHTAPGVLRDSSVSSRRDQSQRGGPLVSPAAESGDAQSNGASSEQDSGLSAPPIAAIPAQTIEVDSRFSIMKHAEIRSVAEILSPDGLAAISVVSGLALALAFLGLVRSGPRPKRHREDPHAVAS